MQNQWRVVAVIIGLLVILIGMGWTVRDRFLPVEVGSEAPDFMATHLDGGDISLADLSGQVVLLNIWATWCAPCREEMPSMQEVHQQLGEEGLQVVAVSIDANPGEIDASGYRGGDVAGFADELGLTFPIWLNPSGDIQRTYRTTGVPESFVIDRNGMIVKKVVGPTDWNSPANVALFERLLADS